MSSFWDLLRARAALLKFSCSWTQAGLITCWRRVFDVPRWFQTSHEPEHHASMFTLNIRDVCSCPCAHDAHPPSWRCGWLCETEGFQMIFLLSISVGTTWQKQAHSFLGRRGKKCLCPPFSTSGGCLWFCAFPFISQGFRNDGKSLQDMMEHLNQSETRNIQQNKNTPKWM